MAETYAIEGGKLTRQFGGFSALRGVDLEVPRGEIRGLIGPNGAGKSTLIDVLSGRAPHWSGSVKMFGTDISAMTAGVVVAITAASHGAGYWALVLLELVKAFTSALLTWLACPWIPGRPVRGSGVRSMLLYGGNLTGFNVINYFARNLDNLLIGRFWGPLPLGLYAK